MEELIPTLQEEGEERIDTLQEGSIIAGVQTINGKAGDLDLKTINGQDILTPGNLSLATTDQLATKQDALTETQLAAVNSGIDSSKVQQIATNTTAIAGKQDQLTQTQLNAVNSGIDETKVAQIATNTGNITSNTNRITTIEGKIPSAATSTNQLTDKNYVDNAIATNTADYISDNGQPFQSLADLEAYSGPLTNNDYAFVVSTDSAGNLLYTRYKYNADQELWAEEYTIANPTFTSTQWAAIDSGVTANDVSQIGTNKSDIAGLQTSKQDALSSTQLDAVNSGIDATKVQQIATNASNITSLQTDKQDKLIAGTNIQIAVDGKTISATDTTYTAGTGLTLTGTQFSVTEPVPTGFFTDTAGTQEGTGSTITLNNTADAPIDNVELKGDTYQFTTTGKNKIDYLTAVPATDQTTTTFVTNGFRSVTTSNGYATKITLAIKPSTTYTLSWNLAIESQCEPRITLFKGTGTSSGTYPGKAATEGFGSVSFTSDSDANAINIWFYNGNKVAGTTVWTYIQLEENASASSYEPYTAGASPNPSYPQDIQVVTGEQTVTVTDGGTNSQTYTIDLGSIELCKIGTYQDYIWKDGNDWKVHKEIRKIVLDGSEEWANFGNAGGLYTTIAGVGASSLSDIPPVKSDKFTAISYNDGYYGNVKYGITVNTAGVRLCFLYDGITGAQAWKTWLSSNNTTAYYVLATATDTVITDASLISQLDALAGSTTYSPQTNYATAGTGTNLPVILTVDVFKNNYAGLLARLNKAGA